MELMNDPTFKSVSQAGWKFPTTTYEKLTEYERSFVKNEFSGLRTPEYYRDRLKQIGFTGLDSVLDAACGMGQWALALAQENVKVEAIDLNAGRIEVAKSLAESYGMKNVQFQTGSIETLPYPDNSFDAVFCYGSFMFTAMEKTIVEFKRVLKPGGRIYVNSNGFGWYLHLIFDRGIFAGNLPLAKTAVKMIFGYFKGKKSQIMITRSYFKKLAHGAGLSTVEIAVEGGINLKANSKRCASAYPEKFYGQEAIWEVLWQK